MNQEHHWRKFYRNKPAMAGVFFVVILLFIWLLGPFIRLDQSLFANDQHLEISLLKPFSKVNYVVYKSEQTSSWNNWLEGGNSHPARSIPISQITLSPDSVLIEHYDKFGSGETQVIPKCELESFNGSFVTSRLYVLGTDKYGRDELSRLMAGSGISLGVGIIAVVISLVLGVVLGLYAGFYKGWVDSLISYLIQVTWAIPTLLLVMAICLAFGSGIWVVFMAVGLTMWVEVARITRGQVLSVREKEYIEAARSLGYSNWRIMFKHILPNVSSSIIVMSAANFASAILMEAGLSFLGLGAKIPTPSWGNMIRESYSYLATDMAYLAFLPGLCIMLLVLSFMLIGNGLRDALDVKS
jgi:peptide/nickel transport system permease protein